MPKRFTPGYKTLQLLPDAGSIGTDSAFMGKYDGAGQVICTPPSSYPITRHFQDTCNQFVKAEYRSATASAKSFHFHSLTTLQTMP
jgi:hypothetical protein